MRGKLNEIICAEVLSTKNNDGCGVMRAADAIIAALPDMVKPLEWVDFEGRGAKATAWGKANYLITKWSTNEFELVESYPGYQGDCIGERFYPNIEAAKSAAQKHHTLSAFGIEGDG